MGRLIVLSYFKVNFQIPCIQAFLYFLFAIMYD